MIIIIIILLLAEPSLSLPIHLATHEVQLHISVDGVAKGYITLGLFEAPKSVESFLYGCSCTRSPAPNCTKAEPRFNEMTTGFNLGFVFPQNTSVTWPSEVNDYHTEFGALGQQRDTEKGTVNPVFRIFLRRMDFDGPRSQWLVFGAIMKDHDKQLLKYLDWTGSSIDGIPMRNITITDCQSIARRHRSDL